MLTPDDEENVKALCPVLKKVLNDEIAAGNEVVETSRGWPGKLCVWLSEPFRRKVSPLPDGVELRDINDPHYWKAEYHHAETDQLLACKFGLGGGNKR